MTPIPKQQIGAMIPETKCQQIRGAVIAILAIALVLVCGVASGADHYVGTIATLTNAAKIAVSNDVIWISNGTYTCTTPMGYAFLELADGVTLRSLSGNPNDVVLDGNASNSVIYMNSFSTWLIGCTVTNGYTDGNIAGGGISGSNGGSASNCIVVGNFANGMDGGGMRNIKGYNLLIINNTASTPAHGGGATYGSVYNCIISGNTADPGGGLWECEAWNTISWGNSSVDYFGATIESYSCGEGYTGTGSITNDPLFVGGGNYRLQASSSCINTGTNGSWTVRARDLDGNQRIWPYGGTVDMGAYEFGSKAKYFTFRIGGTSIFNPGGTGLGNVRGTIE